MSEVTIKDNATVTAISKGSQYSIGIRASSNITISNAEVTAEGNENGIQSYGTVAITGGKVTATGGTNSIYSSGSLTIDGGTVKASATCEPNAGVGILVKGSVTINGGDVTAETQGEGLGVSAGNGVVVGKGVTKFIASGGIRAFDENTKVTNAVAGLGWSDTAGTKDKTGIAAEETGQTLEYKKVQFPVPTYAVSAKAEPAEGGKAEASAEKAAEGATVTLTATPADGYEFDRWVIEGDGAKLDNADSARTKLTMGAANVTATANFKKKDEPAPVSIPDASVTAHVQRIGWMDPVTDGTAAGTTGKSRRMEALTLRLPDGVAGGIEYRGHVQRSGWEEAWASDGAQSGTTGKSRRMEAVQVRLTGAAADAYDVYYRVHVQRYGWMAWAKNGEEAGTQGMSRRAEAIQVVLVKKDAPAPDATYKDVTQNYAKAFVKK